MLKLGPAILFCISWFGVKIDWILTEYAVGDATLSTIQHVLLTLNPRGRGLYNLIAIAGSAVLLLNKLFTPINNLLLPKFI